LRYRHCSGNRIYDGAACSDGDGGGGTGGTPGSVTGVTLNQNDISLSVEGTQYIHANFGTLTALYVQVYNSSGVAVGSESFISINNSLKYVSMTVTVGQEYYIKVHPLTTVTVLPATARTGLRSIRRQRRLLTNMKS